MAYIVGSSSATEEDATATSLEVALPEYAENDLLLACITQDTGSGTFSCAGWTVVGTHAASNGARHGWLAKIAGASETDPTFSSTLADSLIGTVISIRDADISNGLTSAINASGKTDSVLPIASPSVTPAVDNCLLIYSWGVDAASRLELPPDKLIPIDFVGGSSETHCVFYRQQATAAAAPAQTIHGTVADGGTCWVLAIKNAAGGAVAPRLESCVTDNFMFGILTDAAYASTPTVAAAITTSIAGITVNATAPSGGVTGDGITNVDYANDPWRRMSLITWGVAIPAPGEWVGTAFELGAGVNFTGKTINIVWGTAATSSSIIGREGYFCIFADTTGNWVAYTLAKNGIIRPLLSESMIIPTGDTTSLLASSGTMNWSAVKYFGVGYQRSGNVTSSRTVGLKRLMLLTPPVIVGGSLKAPVTAALFGDIFTKAQMYSLAFRQGKGQVQLQVPIQIGNGTDTTVFSLQTQSAENPRAYNGRAAREFRGGDNDLNITIYASASDIISFASGVLVSQTRQALVLHASSSTLATYDFAGAVISGYEITWRDGITCNDAGLVGCYKITANGGTFDGCVIDGSLDAIALTTSDPGEIRNCEFISGGSGHAIEITTPGTYTFSGNLFSGYGSAGTADAAIYNNSGGAVTLNLSGGDTPTVTNGAGASTSLVASATIKVTNLATGTRVLVTRDDTSAVLFNNIETVGEINFGTSYTGDFTVVARKASAAPYYREWFAQGTTVSGQTTSFKAQQQLDE